MKNHLPLPLTSSQRQIMEVVWERGTVTVSEVHEILSKDRSLARNTIQTMMVRLEERGWLQHTDGGRAFLYSAAKPRTVSLGAKVAQMVDRLFGGSPEQMVTALMEYRGLTDSEAERIREMIDASEDQSAPSSESEFKRRKKSTKTRGDKT